MAPETGIPAGVWGRRLHTALSLGLGLAGIPALAVPGLVSNAVRLFGGGDDPEAGLVDPAEAFGFAGSPEIGGRRRDDDDDDDGRGGGGVGSSTEGGSGVSGGVGSGGGIGSF